MGTEENKAVIREIFDLENRDEVDAMASHYAEDVVVHPEPPGGARGVEGVIRFVKAVQSGFSDHHRTIEDMVAEGDRVVVRWVATGTHDGPFLAFAPSGRPTRFEGVTIFRLEDGKVAEGWIIWDRLGLAQQLAPASQKQETGRA